MIYLLITFFTLGLATLYFIYQQNHKRYTLVVAYEENLQKQEFDGLEESIQAAKTLCWKKDNVKYGMVIHNLTGDIRYRFEATN